MALLEVRDIHTYYGRIHALKGITLDVEQGEIVTLIGGNGAGKTTTLNTICGITPASEGTITLSGKEITRKRPHDIVAMGVGQAPEGRKIFTRLRVRENLEMGAYARSDAAGIAKDMEFVFETFPRLKERETQLGGTLSGGEQQMLAIGRALMGHPRILLLDEPSMGLAPLLVRDIFHIIEYLNREQDTRTPTWPWRLPPGVTCFRRARSSSRTTPGTFKKMRWCARPIWARNSPPAESGVRRTSAFSWL
jgi:branched-chain amino acid transport system ATP-binding protein